MAAGLLPVILMCYIFLLYNGVEGDLDLSQAEDLELEKQLRILNKPAIKTIKDLLGSRADFLVGNVSFFLFYSGHVAASVITSLDMRRVQRWKLARTFDALNVLQFVRLLTTRGHYTIDLAVGARILFNFLTDCTKCRQTKEGHIYDYVDLYKQPALDHPLLKNHSYNFQPQFANGKIDEILPEVHETIHIGLKEKNCPVGTVPIKRTTKEDLIRQKYVSKYFDNDWTSIAVSRTRNSEKFAGAFAFFAVYNPKASGKQYSAARIKIQNGNDFIKFGWRVDPTLYGDNFTHLFVQTSTSSIQCFDAKCGFVVTKTDLAPSFIYPAWTYPGSRKNIYETKLRVQRDKDGNWWLSIGNNNDHVGFWPSKLFTELSEFGTYVDWGGEVYTPHGIRGPEMGSGYKPLANRGEDDYMRYITAIDITGTNVNPKNEFYNDSDNSLAYNVIDLPTNDPVWGHMVYFGGKGTDFTHE